MMNLLKKVFPLVLILAFAACEDDNGGTKSCTQSDWVGTYTGLQDCDGSSEAVTVTITASGTDAIVVKYELANVEAEFDPLTPNGCDLDYTESASGITLTVDASIDGNTLTFKDILSGGGSSETCSITATRN